MVIPTNVPVIRFDRDDRMYLTEMDKTNAVLEEIKTFHDVGRPILVGTTSVEKSKELSDELRSRWNTEHDLHFPRCIFMICNSRKKLIHVSKF